MASGARAGAGSESGDSAPGPAIASVTLAHRSNACTSLRLFVTACQGARVTNGDAGRGRGAWLLGDYTPYVVPAPVKSRRHTLSVAPPAPSSPDGSAQIPLTLDPAAYGIQPKRAPYGKLAKGRDAKRASAGPGGAAAASDAGTRSAFDDKEVIWEDVEWDGEALAARAAERLATHGDGVNDFWKAKYEAKASRYWNTFYTRNETRFFKDRHYLDNDFTEFQRAKTEPLTLVEFGCGVGNAVLPLIERLPHLRVFAFDLSSRGIELLRSHELYVSTGRCDAFVLDATTQRLPDRVHDVDLCLMLFMLSAVNPDNMQAAFNEASRVLRPGGMLLMRDYGRYDEAQLRFTSWNKISDNFYVRSDGTQSYFFDLDDLRTLAAGAGLEVVETRYICRRYQNRKKRQVMHRVWVQARFRKPPT